MSQKHPVSDRQLAANRANALKSTGPRTPEGKAAVRANAVTHGITCAIPALSCEKSEAFLEFDRLLRPEFAPRDAIEEDLYARILTTRWAQRRLDSIEHALLEMEIARTLPHKDFDLLSGYALLAVAYQELSKRDNVLPLLNRQLTRLGREHHRLMRLYLEIHGPLSSNPVAAQPEDQPAESPGGQNEPREQNEQNKPIPISGHSGPLPWLPPPPPAAVFHLKLLALAVEAPPEDLPAAPPPLKVAA